MKNISKINNPKGRTYGYQVRVTRAGVEFSKFFAGLTQASLKRARKCRGEIIKMLDNPHSVNKKDLQKFLSS